MSAILKRKLELTSAAMKEVVAEQALKDHKKLKKLEDENARLEEENARLRQENAQLMEQRSELLAQENERLRQENEQLGEERLFRMNVQFNLIPYAAIIARHTRRSTRALAQAVQQVPGPAETAGLSATMALARDFIDRAQGFLGDELPPETDDEL